MKRVLTFLALMLLPLSVMAMAPVSDSTLSDVTGQAGVNINADLTMNIHMDTVAWGDATGVDAAPTAAWDVGGTDKLHWANKGTTGYVGVKGFNINNLRIKARSYDDGYGQGYTAAGAYDSTATIGYNTLFLKPITIDVATVDGGDTDYDTVGGYTDGDDVTFVRFGLGSLLIGMDAMSLDVVLASSTANLANTFQKMGVIGLGAMKIYINPQSYVDIYAHNGCGVNLKMNVIVDEFQLGYVTWGDSDGIYAYGTSQYGVVQDGDSASTVAVPWMTATYTTAGYVGLKDFYVHGPITVNGTVAIDVISSPAGTGIYSGSWHGNQTVVHISFPEDFKVTAGTIVAKVALGNRPDLSGDELVTDMADAQCGILGDIYINKFELLIKNKSWVDIWAH